MPSAEPVRQSLPGEHGAAPPLSVCLVNYNTRDELARCLASIEATAGDLTVEVIVVDNASSDGSADMVLARFPDVRLVRNPDNRGFAAATNQALRQSTGRYALLLNPDVVVCAGALQTLCSFMDRHPAAGAAGGSLHNGDGSFQYYYYRRDHGLPGWLLEIANHMTWNVAPDLMDRLMYARFDPDVETELQMLPGGCMVVRREVLQRPGPLDEDFFLLHEDDEWCRRTRDAGWKLYFCPSARFEHRGGTSFEPWGSARKGAQSLTSRLLFLDKHYPTSLMLIARLALAANFALHLAAFLLARRVGLSKSNRSLTTADRLRWLRIVLLPPRRLRRMVA
ncbi:MAG: glycosyltransferase family 2 protein [Chloroflexi bacterium]|nr:glycosyltransferase family 2 protein [Chloroflexota bacterium]